MSENPTTRACSDDYELILGPNAEPSLRGSVWRPNVEGGFDQIKGRALTYSKNAELEPGERIGSGLALEA